MCHGIHLPIFHEKEAKLPLQSHGREGFGFIYYSKQAITPTGPALMGQYLLITQTQSWKFSKSLKNIQARFLKRSLVIVSPYPLVTSQVTPLRKQRSKTNFSDRGQSTHPTGHSRGQCTQGAPRCGLCTQPVFYNDEDRPDIKGYFRLNNECQECPDNPELLLILIAVAIIVMCGLGWWAIRRQRWLRRRLRGPRSKNSQSAAGQTALKRLCNASHTA